MSFNEAKRIIECYSHKSTLARLREEIFVVQAPEGCPESENGMYILDSECWIDDPTIESIYLDDKLTTINEMMPGLIEDNHFTQEYILDIDLDYFHTVNSINPHDHNTFYNLIRNSKIITIATEPLCVEGGRYENDEINSESLLDALLNHIEHALSSTTIVE